MRRKILSVVFCFILFSCRSYAQLQTTWVKTLYYSLPSISPAQDSLQVGPVKIVMASDETFFVLNNDCPGFNQSIYHVDSLGNILSSIVVGNRTTFAQISASNLYATSDSGCIYLESSAFGGIPDFNLYKISKTGAKSTIYSWLNSDGGPIELVNTVIPNHHNGYYCRIDTEYFDIPSGIFIPGNIQCVFDNDDYLVSDSVLSRKDVSGNIIWSIPNEVVIAHTETSIYLTSDSLTKVDAITGNKLWTKPLPPGNQFDIMHSTDGLISIDNRTINILDSSGTIIDSNFISLTYSLPTAISSGNDGSIYTGGLFIDYVAQIYRNYSSFLIKVNAEAKGVADSTTFFPAGDANNDSTPMYIEDGLFVAAAIGQTTNLNQLNINIVPGYTTYCELWPNESDCGVNYRYSDGVMDGIINADDVNFLDRNYCYNAISNNDTSGSEVRVVYDNNVLLPGDTLKACVILGTSINPTDSIYGFSIEPLVSRVFDFGRSFVVDYKNGVLGDTATNLTVFASNASTSNPYLGLIFCRNDHQNVSIAGDTIFSISAVLPSTFPTGFYTFPSTCFMIKENGCFVPVNVIDDTLIVVVTSVENSNQKDLANLFPNPASNTLNISTDNISQKEILIKNVLGRTVYNSNFSGDHFSIQIENWSNGIYFLEVSSSGFKKQFKIIVEH